MTKHSTKKARKGKNRGPKNPIKAEAIRRGFQYLDKNMPIEYLQQTFLMALQLHKPCMADRETWDRFNEHAPDIDDQVDEIIGFDPNIAGQQFSKDNPIKITPGWILWPSREAEAKYIAEQRIKAINKWYGMEIAKMSKTIS